MSYHISIASFLFLSLFLLRVLALLVPPPYAAIPLLTICFSTFKGRSCVDVSAASRQFFRVFREIKVKRIIASGVGPLYAALGALEFSLGRENETDSAEKEEAFDCALKETRNIPRIVIVSYVSFQNY